MTNAKESLSVTPRAVTTFDAQRLNIVQEVVARSLSRRQEVAQHGEQAEQLLSVGLDFTTQALAVALRLQDLQVLDQQLDWAAERLPHDGVSSQHLISRFQILADVITETLPQEDALAINCYVQHMIDRIRNDFSTDA